MHAQDDIEHAIDMLSLIYHHRHGLDGIRLCEEIGIELETDDRLKYCDARMARQDGEVIITVPCDVTDRFLLTFLISHEIGHVTLRFLEASPNKVCGHRIEEELCDRFGALMMLFLEAMKPLPTLLLRELLRPEFPHPDVWFLREKYIWYGQSVILRRLMRSHRQAIQRSGWQKFREAVRAVRADSREYPGDAEVYRQSCLRPLRR